MKTKKIWGRYFLFFILLGVLNSSCATRSYIDIDYRLPDKQGIFRGKSIFIDVRDQREDESVISGSVRKEIKSFLGIFSLTVAKGGQTGVRVGTYDLVSLFREALKKRLSEMDVKVLPFEDKDQPVLKISIKEFFLDLADRNWSAKISCDAVLIKDGKALFNQGVRGEAEKLKLLGRKGADELLGDIFSDVVNTLDIQKMFQRG